MESPGEYLKREREIRGVRLEVISDVTKIRVGLLTAIERNDFDALPAAPFVKGFIQAYCKYLGLDVQDALLRYEAYMRSIAEKETAQLKHESEAKGQKSEAPVFNPPVVIIVIASVAALIIVVALYVISKKQPIPFPVSSSTQTQQPSDSSSQPENVRISKKEESVPSLNIKSEGRPNQISNVSPAQTPLKKEDKKQKQAMPIGGDKPFTLIIEAAKPSWLKIEIDGQNPFEISLKQGEKVKWNAKEKFSVLIGNAGGVNAIFNGEPLGSLGDEGRVVKLILPSDKAGEGPAIKILNP